MGSDTLAMVEISTVRAVNRTQTFSRSKLCGALEAACERALLIGARSYSSVNSILKNHLHREAA